MRGIVVLLAIRDSMAASDPDGRGDRVSGHGWGGPGRRRPATIDPSDGHRSLRGWAKFVFRRHVRL